MLATAVLLDTGSVTRDAIHQLIVKTFHGSTQEITSDARWHIADEEQVGFWRRLFSLGRWSGNLWAYWYEKANEVLFLQPKEYERLCRDLGFRELSVLQISHGESDILPIFVRTLAKQFGAVEATDEFWTDFNEDQQKEMQPYPLSWELLFTGTNTARVAAALVEYGIKAVASADAVLARFTERDPPHFLILDESALTPSGIAALLQAARQPRWAPYTVPVLLLRSPAGDTSALPDFGGASPDWQLPLTDDPATLVDSVLHVFAVWNNSSPFDNPPASSPV